MIEKKKYCQEGEKNPMAFLISSGAAKVIAPDTNPSFRINPSIVPGGCSNMQYANYLAHGNPCGTSTLVSLPVGTGEYSFTTIRNYLSNILAVPEVQTAYNLVRSTGTVYVTTPNDSTFGTYLQALNDYGVLCARNMPLPNTAPRGYEWRVSVYDSSGNTYYDSHDRLLQVSVNGVATQVKLVPNPFGVTETPLYGLALKPCYLGYIDVTAPNGYETKNSVYTKNQNAYPESTFAITTLLVGLSSQKSFPNSGFGYGARQQFQGKLGYYVTYYFVVLTVPPPDYKLPLSKFQPSIIDLFFVRLGLEQALPPGPR